MPTLVELTKPETPQGPLSRAQQVRSLIRNTPVLRTMAAEVLLVMRPSISFSGTSEEKGDPFLHTYSIDPNVAKYGYSGISISRNSLNTRTNIPYNASVFLPNNDELDGLTYDARGRGSYSGSGREVQSHVEAFFTVVFGEISDLAHQLNQQYPDGNY